MAGRKRSYCLHFSPAQLSEIRRLGASYTAPYHEVLRARILLLSHDHPEWSNPQIAARVGCARPTVTKFRQRWAFEGSLKNHPRPGASRRLGQFHPALAEAESDQTLALPPVAKVDRSALCGESGPRAGPLRAGPAVGESG